MDVLFSHPSELRPQKDGRKVRPRDEGTFTSSTAADDQGSRSSRPAPQQNRCPRKDSWSTGTSATGRIRTDVHADWDESLRERAARENAGRALRPYSVASRIMAGLPGTPVLTIQTASRIRGVSRTIIRSPLFARYPCARALGAFGRLHSSLAIRRIQWIETSETLPPRKIDTRTLRHGPRPRHDARRHPVSDHR